MFRKKKKDEKIFNYKFNIKDYPTNINILKYDYLPVKFGDVFEKYIFFKDDEYPSEFEKYKHNMKFIDKFRLSFEKMNWIKCSIKIEDLFGVYLCPTGWLRKFSCFYKNCKLKYINKDECIKCKINKIFTLKDTIDGFLNKTTIFSEKINSINSKIKDSIDNKDYRYHLFLFCFLIQDNNKQFFCADGNSRLLAYALYCYQNNILNKTISCYIGLNKK